MITVSVVVIVFPVFAISTLETMWRSMSSRGRCQSRSTTLGPANRFIEFAIRGPTPVKAVVGRNKGLSIGGRTGISESLNWLIQSLPSAGYVAMNDGILRSSEFTIYVPDYRQEYYGR